MKTILIDTNILCLLVAGACCPEAIGRHKRLRSFEIVDYHRIVEIGRGFHAVMTCLHVLTETSNLLAQTDDRQKSVLLNGLATWITEVEESQRPSRAALSRPEYARLGITDAMLLVLAESGALLLTVDLPLYLAVVGAGYHAINYHHVRDGAITLSEIGAWRPSSEA